MSIPRWNCVEGAQLNSVFIFVNLRVPKICWSILGWIRRFQCTHEPLECCCAIFGKSKNSVKFFLWVTGDFLPQTRLIFWPSVLVGKRCENLNSLRALERVLKSLGRWKNINFLKSSPRRAEVQILEETPCKHTSVCFTILTAWLVPTDSVCQVWCQLLLYLLRNWLKQTAQEGAQEGEFYEVLWDCLNTLFKERGQIAAHYRCQCKLIVLLPKKRAWALFAVRQNLGWHVRNSTSWNTVIPNVCTVLKLHLVISAQINFYSLVPQLTWDCVVDFEVDPAFLALALASGVFFSSEAEKPKKHLENLWPVTGS